MPQLLGGQALARRSPALGTQARGGLEMRGPSIVPPAVLCQINACSCPRRSAPEQNWAECSEEL